ncbi:MAG: serine hydrolase domain-containing protein [Betaproteobacteria bacterium]
MRLTSTLFCGFALLSASPPVIFSPGAHAQQQAETPASRVMLAWLAAFNSGDDAQFKVFDETYKPTRSMSKMRDFRNQVGGFTLARIEKNEATAVTALLKEKGSDNVVRMEMTVTADDPPKMVGARLQLIPPPADLAPARLAEADAMAAIVKEVDAAARDDQFSGVVLIARNGKVIMEKAWGQADRASKVPVALDTQFRIGSMNKMFTSVAILQLIDAGKLSLDDTVGKRLPDYPNKDVAGKVTIRHLLTHTGGTGDIFGPEFDKQRLTLKTHADYLKLYGERAPGYEPGAQSRYSNYGFVLLGAIIEKISGMSYYDYVQKNIFQPAGMTATASLPENEKVAKRSMGYMKEGGKWVANTDTLPWRGTSAGGGYSTAGDLLRFAEALQSGKLVSKPLLAEATRNQADRYGFGFGVRADGKWQSYGHGGGAPGMNGELRIIPQQGYVLVALSNLDPPAASRVLDFVGNRLPGSD